MSISTRSRTRKRLCTHELRRSERSENAQEHWELCSPIKWSRECQTESMVSKNAYLTWYLWARWMFIAFPFVFAMVNIFSKLYWMTQGSGYIFFNLYSHPKTNTKWLVKGFIWPEILQYIWWFQVLSITVTRKYGKWRHIASAHLRWCWRQSCIREQLLLLILIGRSIEQPTEESHEESDQHENAEDDDESDRPSVLVTPGMSCPYWCGFPWF